MSYVPASLEWIFRPTSLEGSNQTTWPTHSGPWTHNRDLILIFLSFSKSYFLSINQCYISLLLWVQGPGCVGQHLSSRYSDQHLSSGYSDQHLSSGYLDQHLADTLLRLHTYGEEELILLSEFKIYFFKRWTLNFSPPYV